MNFLHIVLLAVVVAIAIFSACFIIFMMSGPQALAPFLILAIVVVYRSLYG